MTADEIRALTKELIFRRISEVYVGTDGRVLIEVDYGLVIALGYSRDPEVLLLPMLDVCRTCGNQKQGVECLRLHNPTGEDE